MIDEIKKDLRTQVEAIQEDNMPMGISCGEFGVRLSGSHALALLEYIESLEVKESSFNEVELHKTYRMKNGDQITITSYDPHEFYCFGGYVDDEFYTFAKNGAWSRHHESQHDLVAEIKNPDK